MKIKLLFLFLTVFTFSLPPEASAQTKAGNQGAGLMLTSVQATITPKQVKQFGAASVNRVSSENTGTVILDFEGLGDADQILDFYNNGTSNQGFSGTDYAISFNADALALIDSDAGGGGNFANEPSPSTIMFFTQGTPILNFPAGFDTGFSLFQTNTGSAGSIEVYEGLDGTGTLLGTATLNALSSAGNGDPAGIFDTWEEVSVPFSGTAMSIKFIGAAGAIGFDDITFGNVVAGCDAFAGEILFDDESTEFEGCAGTGELSSIDVLEGGQPVGESTGWIITDASDGTILGLPVAPPFDLSGAPAGTCNIYKIAYDDGLTGLMMQGNIANLDGCFDLSDPISVIRLDDCPSEGPMIVCSGDIIVNPDPEVCGAQVELIPPTISGGTTTTGNALGFEGVNNGFIAPDFLDNILGKLLAEPLNGASISAWIYPSVSDPEFSSLDINGQIFDANTWHHIAFTYDLSILKIYHNGVLLGSVAIEIFEVLDIIEDFNGALPEVSDALQNLNIPSFPFTLSGKLDEVHIWKGARTQEEIQTEMNSEIDAQPNLIALYHFNQGVAGGDNTGLINVIDDSGNGFDLTLTNFDLNGPTSNWVEGKSFNGVTLTNDAPTSYAPIDYTLDGYTFTWNGPNTASYPAGANIVTWTAVDTAGNETTCTQTVTVSIDEYTWNGNVDTDWTDDGNWVSNSSPGLSVNAMVNIPTGMPNYPVLTSGQNLHLGECSHVIIDPSASLTINPNVVVSNDGIVDNVGGTLTFESDATGSAYIGAGTGDFTGDVKVERFIPARRAFRFLSSPVTTDDYISGNWQQDTHITGSTTQGENGFDATITGNPSMFTFDNLNPSWNAVPNTDATNLESGIPYRLMVRGDRNTDLTDNDATPSPTTLMATGVLTAENDGHTSLDLNSNPFAFNFIGNPFQAPVDMKAALDDNPNILPLWFYVWDPTLGIRGAYVIYDVDFGATAGEQNQYLQAGQACFVETDNLGGPTSFTFTQAHKNTTQVEPNVFKSSGKKAVSQGQLSLKLYESSAYSANQTPADGLLILFDDTWSNDVDHYDAIKFTNLDENFATNNNGTLLTIERRNTPSASDIIPLEINTYRNTDYVIVASAAALQGDTPLLIDTYLNQTTELFQNGETTYAYSIDPGIPASFADDRFEIIFQKTLSNTSLDLNEILLYPNPTNTGSFNLNIPQSINDLEMTIYNTLGAKIFYKNDFIEKKALINTNFAKSQGVYFVKLSSEGKTTTKKLIIN